MSRSRRSRRSRRLLRKLPRDLSGPVAMVSAFATVGTAMLMPASLTADQGLYLGIGAGATRLEPVSRTEALTVLDEDDTGFHGFIGYDVNRWFAAEGYLADFGSAGIGFLGEDVGDVDYQLYGIRGLGYLWSASGGLLRKGVTDGSRTGPSVYLAAGVGGLETDSELSVRTDHRAHASFAAGVEMGFGAGFALRAEIAGYDTDARYASLSLLKRFGDRKVEPVPAPKAVPEPEPAPEPPAVAPPAVTAEPEPAVQPFFGPIVPPYVYFEFDAAVLTAESLLKLDTFADELLASDMSVEIDGHTDSVGPEDYNIVLSERRANAVLDALVNAGVDASRLSIVGLGEQQPVESNATAEGRAANRRAYFTLR